MYPTQQTQVTAMKNLFTDSSGNSFKRSVRKDV